MGVENSKKDELPSPEILVEQIGQLEEPQGKGQTRKS